MSPYYVKKQAISFSFFIYVHRILLSICRLFLDLFVIFKLFLSEIKERINKNKNKN